MNRIREAWKAVLAFIAPGAVLIVERLLADGAVDGETLRRSLIAGALTSALVYFKRNGASPSQTTSTPQTDAGISVVEGVLIVLLVLVILLVVGAV